ncbi:hypothetical protein BASA61_001055 [Batrachochytrium salamandrivorans]|nr:hypothetical protein BASA61_001055 [Batrachochytrium salamandrivorans]
MRWSPTDSGLRPPLAFASEAKALLRSTEHISYNSSWVVYHSAASASVPDGFHRYAPVLSDIPHAAADDRCRLVREPRTAVKKRSDGGGSVWCFVLLRGDSTASLIAALLPGD